MIQACSLIQGGHHAHPCKHAVKPASGSEGVSEGLLARESPAHIERAYVAKWPQDGYC